MYFYTGHPVVLKIHIWMKTVNQSSYFMLDSLCNNNNNNNNNIYTTQYAKP